jgi:hypothetical protein
MLQHLFMVSQDQDDDVYAFGSLHQQAFFQSCLLAEEITAYVFLDTQIIIVFLHSPR